MEIAKTNNAAAKPAAALSSGAARAGKIALISVAALGALLALTCAVPYIYGKTLPKVSVGRVQVGGLLAEDAATQVEKNAQAMIKAQSMTVLAGEQSYAFAPETLVKQIDAEGSAEAALQYGRQGGPIRRVAEIFSGFLGEATLPLALSIDEQKLADTIEQIHAAFPAEPSAPTWQAEGDNIVVKAGRAGVAFLPDKVREQLVARIAAMDFSPLSLDIRQTPAAPISADWLIEQAVGEMQNATVDKADSTTIIPDRAGVSLDEDEARRIIGDGTAAEYKIPATTTLPEVTAAELSEVLFRDVIAEATTEVATWDVPRTANVALAAQSMNGAILNPGEEFSYHGVVGECSAATGYQAAGAFSGGKVVMEYGGGICQTSSTLYMATLRANLQITERLNHSFPIGYTPLGEDATVSWGGPDFRFVNNTKYPIKILAEQVDDVMHVALYGTKTGDITVEPYTEVIGTTAPKTVEKVDSSLAPNQTVVDDSGSTGYRTRTYLKITENGETRVELANESNYITRDRVVRVGPAPKPTPQPAADPEQTADPEQPTADEPAPAEQPAAE